MQLRWLGCLLVALGGCREARKPAAAPTEAAAKVTAPAPAATAKAKAPAPAPKVVAPGSGSAAASAVPVAISAPVVAAPPTEPAKPPEPALPESLERRIRYQLRDLSPAPIALRYATLFPGKRGGAEVLGLYEYSMYEDCVKRDGGSRAEARLRCFSDMEVLTDGLFSTHAPRMNRHCKRLGLFYARIGAAPELAKGALEVAHLPFTEEDCDLVEVAELAIDDRDGDGRAELVAEVVLGHEAPGDLRYEDKAIDQAVVRVLWVAEAEREAALGLRLQLELRAGKNRIDYNAELAWADLNSDGRKDLVQVVDCNARAGAGAHDDTCEIYMRKRIWYLYDRELDEWRELGPDEDKPAPGAAPDAGAEEAKTPEADAVEAVEAKDAADANDAKAGDAGAAP